MISITTAALKKKIKHSFVRRLTWNIMTAILIVMLLFSALISWFSMYVMNIVIETYYYEYNKNSGAIVNEELSGINLVAINSVDKIDDRLKDPETIYPILERVLSQNPDIIGCGVAFMPHYFPEKGRWFEPVAIRDKDGRISSKQIGGADHDYFSREWHKKSIGEEGPRWNMTYYDERGVENFILKLTLPLNDFNGKLAGIFFIDMPVDWIADIIKRRDKEENDFMGDDDNTPDAVHSLILGNSHEGTYVIRTDSARRMSGSLVNKAVEAPDTLDRQLTRLVEQLQREQNDGKGFQPSFQTKIDDRNVYGYATKINNMEWTVVTLVPKILVTMSGYILAFFLVIMIIVTLIAVFFVSRRAIRKISHPLLNFVDSTGEIAKGNFEAQLPNAESEDEIGLLHDAFANMQQSLAQHVENLKAATASKAAIENELKIAYNIQMAMVPKKFPPFRKRTDIDVYGYLAPAKAVGGDLFDFYIRGRNFFFCIGDVSGKGIPAALIMTVAKNLFRSVSSREEKPNAIITQINDTMSEGNSNNMFVTLFIGVLDLETGHLEYCNGGHEAPLIIGSEVTQLRVKPNCPVGLLPGMAFAGEETVIAPDTTIMLYTDGITEAVRGEKEEERIIFGIDRVMETARQALTPEQQQPRPFTEKMLEAVHDFTVGYEQSDDMTILTIRYYGKQQNQK